MHPSGGTRGVCAGREESGRSDLKITAFWAGIIRYWVRVGEEQFIIDDANVDLSGARSGAVQLCLDTRKLHILKDGGSHDT